MRPAVNERGLVRDKFSGFKSDRFKEVFGGLIDQSGLQEDRTVRTVFRIRPGLATTNKLSEVDVPNMLQIESFLPCCREGSIVPEKDPLELKHNQLSPVGTPIDTSAGWKLDLVFLFCPWIQHPRS